jgi:hypothetical protein
VTKEQVRTALWKILFGLVLIVLLINAIHLGGGWPETLSRRLLGYSFSPEMVNLVVISLMALLSFELIHFTLGKKRVLLSLPQFMNVLIAVTCALILANGLAFVFESHQTHGVLWLIFADEAAPLREASIFQSSLLSMLSGSMIQIYAALIVVYLYQISRIKVSLDLFDFLRIIMIIMGLLVLFSFRSPIYSMERLLFSLFALSVALVVYKRTAHSLRAYLIALVVLFVL